jgi:four helix bundle protein
MRTYGFERLEVWQCARVLVKDIYLVVKKFPDSEKYGLVNQLCRAAVSVASNLAEGNSRSSAREQAYFSQIAYGSLMEVVCQITLAVDLAFVALNDVAPIRMQIEQLSAKLSALRRSQLKRCEGRG